MNQQNKDLIIGIDASTTGCKVAIWNFQGEQVASGRCEILLLKPNPDWYEQSAQDWWCALQQALAEATTQIDIAQLAGICISPQRETFVPVDESGHPLRNAILWMDNRASAFLPEIKKTIPEFHRMTGKPLSGNLTVLKILWLRENEPKIFAQTYKYLDVAAYLNFYLTGNYATGWGIADPTGLFDMEQNGWSEEMLQFLQLRVSQLPAVHPAGAIIGQVTEAASLACSLPVGLPVIVGVGDGQSGGLGLKVTRPGECYLSLGTSVVSGTYTETYVTDLAFRTMVAGIPQAYSLETVILSGTYLIDWFMDHFSSGKSLAHFEDELNQLPPGPGDLLLVPYWNSALTPYWDSTASGMILGWKGHHSAVHLYQAILEGIAYELRLHFEGVESATQHAINNLMVMGGGSQSDHWCQILADVTGKEIRRADVTEATTLGAVILAAYGIGAFDSIRAAALAMGAEAQTTFSPHPQRYARYSKVYAEVYRHLFPNLQPLIGRLAQIQVEN